MPFVLDNSVVTGWYLSDQASPYTEAVAVRLQDDKALVPALWQLELANVLKTACSKGKRPHERSNHSQNGRPAPAAHRQTRHRF